MAAFSDRPSASNSFSFSQSASRCSRGIERSRSQFSASAARPTWGLAHPRARTEQSRALPIGELIQDATGAGPESVSVRIEFRGFDEFFEEFERADIAIIVEMLGDG